MAVTLNQPSGLLGTSAGATRLSAGHRFERILAGIMLFLAATPFFDLLGTGPYAGIVTQMSWASLYLMALTLLTVHLRDRWIVWTARHLPAVVFVLAVVLFSNFWTLDQSLTLRRSFSLAGTCLIGLYLGLRFSPADLLRIVFWTVFLLVVLSVAAVLVSPSYGIRNTSDGGPAEWKGVLHHKQTMGAVAAYGAIACLAFLTSQTSRRLMCLAFLIVFAFAIVMARSVTALTGFAVAVVGILSLMLMRQFRFPILGAYVLVTYGAGVLALVAAVLIAIADLSVLTDLVGRDATLTGRMSTWRDALGMLADRPLLGFGYEAVWGLSSGTHLPEFLKSAISSHAHNGYLNLATQIGIPAALAAIGFLLVTFFRAVREFFFEPSAFLTFSVGYVAMFLTENVTRSALFTYQQFEWVLFMAVSVMVTRIAFSQAASRARVFASAYASGPSSMRVLHYRSDGLG